MAVALVQPPKNPNPQGKGMIPFLLDWGTMQPCVGGPKTASDFLRDYCVSSLILTATFRFKPVVGNNYFLYCGADNWTLSLVAPDEWGQRIPGEFLARCRLRPDMTWEMATPECDEHSEALAKARIFIRRFVDALSAQESIASQLPFYVSGLPYYQRLLATALASSLQRSLPRTGDDMQALLKDLPERLTIASTVGSRKT